MAPTFDMEAFYADRTAEHEQDIRQLIFAGAAIEKMIARMQAGKEANYLDTVAMLKALGSYFEGYDNEFKALAAEIEENNAPPTREEWRQGEHDYNRKVALDMGA